MAEEQTHKKLEDFKTMGKDIKKSKEKVETKSEVKEEVKEVKTEDKKEAQKSKPAIEKSKKEAKVTLEREYVIPLRIKVNKIPRYKRAKKAVRIVKEFLAKHMKVESRDIRKVKVNINLNNEIWFRGIKNPPAKIKVKAKKDSEGIVYVELAEISEKVRYNIERIKKKEAKFDKKALKQIAKQEKKEKQDLVDRVHEETKEDTEKEKASAEAGLKSQKQEAKVAKHQKKLKQPKQNQIQRKALKR